MDAGRRETWTLLALVALAAVVRLPGLGYGFWVDEAATMLSFVPLPLGELLTSYPSPNHHVLYSALAHLSVDVFGEHEWAVRLPAYLFGVATVPALYLLARERLSRAEALGIGLILAVSYHHAYFSQNARGYTGQLFFAVLGTFFLLRALGTGRRRWWVGYAVAGALNVYVLLSGLFVVASQALGALLLHVLPAPRGRRGTAFLRLSGWTGLAAVFTLAIYAPMLGDIFEFYTTADAGSVGWRLSENLLGVILQTALPTQNRWVLTVGAALALPVLAGGAWRLARRVPLVFFAFLLPPLIELVVAAGLGAGSYPRRFILVLPLGAMLGVAGVWAIADLVGRWRGLGRPWTALYAAGVLAGMAAVAVSLPRLYGIPKQDFPGALSWVAERETADDEVVAASVAQGPMEYYRPDVVVVRTAAELETELAGGSRIWLISTFPGDLARFEPELDALIRSRFTERQRFPALVGDGTVIVWESRSGGV